MRIWLLLGVLSICLVLRGPISYAQGHGREGAFHALTGNVYVDVSGEAVASEIEVGWHPKNSVQGIGILVGIFGNPASHGLFGAAFMLTAHFRSSRVQGHVRIGIVHEFIAETRTFPRMVFHLYGTGAISPSFLMEAGYRPSSWGQRSQEELRIDVGVGPSFQIFGNATLHVPFIFSVPNVMEGLARENGWMLGPRVIVEYQFL